MLGRKSVTVHRLWLVRELLHQSVSGPDTGRIGQELIIMTRSRVHVVSSSSSSSLSRDNNATIRDIFRPSRKRGRSRFTRDRSSMQGESRKRCHCHPGAITFHVIFFLRARDYAGTGFASLLPSTAKQPTCASRETFRRGTSN